jgi:filamentous hemagglutinin family protein
MSRKTGLFFLLSLSLIGFGKPRGERVVSGTADISHDLDGLMIHSGKKTVLEWDFFSVDPQERVQFNQFDRNSAVLNRIIGQEKSEIYGKLISNGKIYLVNPQGVLIGPGAKIEAASFIASTLDILTADFLEDHFHFSSDSVNSVINLGWIECPNGHVALLGRKVENKGTILAEQGHVELLSGLEVLLQPEGESSIFIKPTFEEKIEGTAVDHSGLIKALAIDLKAGVTPYQKAVSSSGEIDAHRVVEKGGRVFLVSEGLTELSGSIDASGEKGGSVQVLGEEVHVLNGAKVDVSGTRGGGEVLIGGDYQGKNPKIKNAKYTWAGQVDLAANAVEKGAGGRVISWADEANWFYGRIDIRGGLEGGDGGFAEVSGKILEYHGKTEGKSLGKPGTLLLDPTDITIGALATSGTWGSCTSNPPVPGNSILYNIAAGATNNILNTDLQTQLASCNVFIDTVGSGGAGPNSGSITVSSPVTWSAQTGLYLRAASFISISANITATGSFNTPYTAMAFTGVSGTGSNPGILLNNALLQSGTAAGHTGDIILFGTSANAATSANGVTISGTAQVITFAGNINIGGRVPTGSALSLLGVSLGSTNSSVVSTTGAITISGSTNSSANNSRGVSITGTIAANTTGSMIFGGTVTDGVGGVTTVFGCQGGTGTASHGIHIASQLTTGGNLVFTNCIGGTNTTLGGNGINSIATVTAAGNIVATNTIRGAGLGGAGVLSSANFQATGAGSSITLSATALGTTGSCNGIFISGGNLATTNAADGGMTLTGTGGVSTTGSSSGVIITAGSISTVAGTMTINGFASSSVNPSNGVTLAGANGCSSTSGNIFVTGTATGSGATCIGLSASTSTNFNTIGTVTLSGAGSGSSGVQLSSGVYATSGDLVFQNCIGGPAATGVFLSSGFNCAGNFIATNNIVSLGTAFFSGTITVSGAGKSIQITGSGLGLGIGGNFQTTSPTGGGITLLGTGGTTSGVNVTTVSTAANNSPIIINATTTGASFASRAACILSGGGFLNAGTGSITLSGTIAGTPSGCRGVEFNSSTITCSTITISGHAGAAGVTSSGFLLNGSVAFNGDVVFENCVGSSAGGSGIFFTNNAITCTGNFTATNNILGQGSGGVGFQVAAGTASLTFSGSNKTVTIRATATGTTSACHGISLGGQTISSAGTVTLTGVSGASSTASSGILIPSGTFSGATGAVTLNGTSNSTVASSHGVSITGALVNSFGGTLTISGTGGTGVTSHGANMAGAVTAAGNVVFTNCSGGSNGGNGVNLVASLITTGNVFGTNSIVGAGASGIGFLNGASLQTTGVDKVINLVASSSGNSGAAHGISVSGGAISSTSGTISLVGVGGGGSLASHGIDLSTLNPLLSTSGPIVLSGSTACAVNSSFGVSLSVPWSPGTVGTVTWTNCVGGGGTSCHAVNLAGAYTGGSNSDLLFNNCLGGASGGNGVNVAAAVTNFGNVIATNTIIGRGSSGVGFATNFNLQTLKSIFITASSTGTTGSCHGISLTNGNLSSVTGSISLMGTGGASTTAASHGVSMTGASSITGTDKPMIMMGTASGTQASSGLSLLNTITAFSGTISLSGYTTASADNSHGVTISGDWSPGTTGPLIFSNCRGGTGQTSHGINLGGALTSSGNLIATNSIVGGSGLNSYGFRAASSLSSAGSILLTATTLSTARDLNFGGNVTTTNGPITVTGNSLLANSLSFLGQGATGSVSFNGVIVGASKALTITSDASISVTGTVNLSDTASFEDLAGAGGALTATGSSSVTFSNIDTSSASGNGGAVSLTSTGSYISVGNINTSSSFGGANGGNMTLQPSTAAQTNATTLPPGYILLNGTTYNAAPGAGGTGGAISFATSSRLGAFPTTATIFGNYDSQNNVTLTGASFQMGAGTSNNREVFTVLGNLTINTTGNMIVGDLIALNAMALTASGGTITVNSRSSNYILSSTGVLYSSSSAHLYARTSATFSPTPTSSGSFNSGVVTDFPLLTQYSTLSAMYTALAFGSSVLNLDQNSTTPTPPTPPTPSPTPTPIPTREQIIDELGIADTELFDLLKWESFWVPFDQSWRYVAHSMTCEQKKKGGYRKRCEQNKFRSYLLENRIKN